METNDPLAGREAAQVQEGTLRLLRALFPERFTNAPATVRVETTTFDGAGPKSLSPED